MEIPLRLDERNLPGYLVASGLAAESERLVVEPAGDGNINWVRRVVGPRRSWVVKQARSALEAFPEYSAPTQRIAFEAHYFEVAAAFDADGICPRIEFFDAPNSVLVLEDLSDSQRMDAAIAAGRDVGQAAGRVAAFLARVHDQTADLDLAGAFENTAMRRLHGDHIFWLPYRDNDFPVSPAVGRRAESIRNDADLLSIIDTCYAKYLDPRGALVHADVQPTNILIGRTGPKLLDAEIAHVGDPAFDIGILLAHLYLAELAGSVDSGVPGVWDQYANAFANHAPPRFCDAARFAGIELLRRTLGAARAAGVERDDCALRVLEFGTRLVESPPSRAL